jgi:hypothetical protein
VPKTLKACLTQHQNEIALEHFCKTFQDAVVVAQKLGVRYLWVDSLCIVQDDPDDFRRECAQMNHVYARAYRTISAQDVKNDTEDLFLTRGTLCLELSTRQEKFQGPLSNRGWTLQEHYLSPRIVHFTQHCILWEC